MKTITQIKQYFLIVLTVLAGLNIAYGDVTDAVIQKIDNSDNQRVVIIGDWQTSTWTGGGDFNESNYIHDKNAEKGLKKVRFIPDILTGNYDVYLRYTSSANRANNVPVDIYHAGGVTTKTINQKQNGGKWILLGAYDFTGEGTECVEIRNDDTNGYVIADAVAFIESGSGEPCFPDLVSYWNFDQAGEVIFDQAGGNAGWVEGAVETTGIVNECLEFDGNDSVLVGDSESLRLVDMFTLSAWIKESVPSQYAKIVSRRDGDYFYFLGVDNGKPYAGIGDGDSYTTTSKTKTMPSNEWHHLAAVYRADVDSLKLYYDGDLIETVSVVEELPYTEGIALSIGSDEEGTEMFFKGWIDELAVFDTALPDDDIMTLYMKGLAGNNYCDDSLCGNGAIDPGEDCDGGVNCPSNCRYGECYATNVVSYTPGLRKDGTPILAERSNPENALGVPQGTDDINFVSLGFGGTLVLQFDSKIINRTGPDFKITETSYNEAGCDEYPETAHVYGSQDADTWEDLGTGCLDSEYDLGSLEYATFIKIVDESDPEAFGNGDDGFDVDGVEALSCRDANFFPVANDDVVSTDEDIAVTIEVLLNDTDEDGDSLSVNGISQPSNGAIMDNGDGIFTYSPAPDYSGTDAFTYTIGDGKGGSDSAVVTITINPVNDAPIANDDHATTSMDESVRIDVLSNDADADGDFVSIDSIVQPANGTATDNGDDTITYLPDPGFFGDDIFSYTVIDGNGGSSMADVYITVTDRNMPPAVSISPEVVTIGQGDSVTLSWTTSRAEYAHIDNGIGPVSTSGFVTVDPEYTTVYVLTVTGPGGSASVQAVVHVAGDPAEQPEGSFGYIYNDIIPEDAGIDYYEEKRFSIVTGIVYNIDELPIEGVSATILDHPEYGSAVTDSDGRYTLPVEGGGVLTVAFKKKGLITAHRQVDVPWNDFAVVDSITMMEEDSVSTSLTFDGNPETTITHQSSAFTDEFGARSCSMVFTGDNHAFLVDEDGNDIHELNTINVRATEFVTPESMPAVLPPTSAYTYCAELSVDGAERVRFERPVITWVDNFLGFDVGEIVPVGFYNRDIAIWKASDNGLIVKLLDEDSDGKVDSLDADGDNLPDDINQNGSFLDEVAGLQDDTRYFPGDTYWRVEISHFTPWDCNWPYGPPQDAIGPNPNQSPDSDDQRCEDEDCKQYINSYVEERSRIYHEDLDVPGTDMTLHYASNKARGYKKIIRIPASGNAVPNSLEEIIVKVTIAGRVFEQTLAPLPNQTAEFVWNGFDAFGKKVNHSANAKIEIGFRYKMIYYGATRDWVRAFANVGLKPIGVYGRSDIILWKHTTLIIDYNSFMFEEISFGEGWGLSSYHLLSPYNTSRLFKGNGTTIVKQGIITTIAGIGNEGFSGDGGPATQAEFDWPNYIIVDPAGNIIVSDSHNNRIREIDTNGIITTIAGNGVEGYSGDGGNAIDAALDSPDGIIKDSEGNLIFADSHNHRIRKIDKNGIISTIVGTGTNGFSGDDGLAINADISYPHGICMDSAGNLYFGGDNRIRKVDTNGVITTVTGNGIKDYSGDGGPAAQAQINMPQALCIDTDGNLFFSDYGNHRVRKIDTSGIITTIAGTGSRGFSGDGGPAIDANLTCPQGLFLDEADNIYIVDRGPRRVRKVNSSGIIWTVAGDGSFGNSGDGGPATQASFCDPINCWVDLAGNIYISDGYGNAIRKVNYNSDLTFTAATSEQTFAEKNGIGHVMSSKGIHLRTINLDTGVTFMEFGYDANYNLESITDRFGRSTIIERDLNDIPIAIVSPYGLRTTLLIDSNNLLEKVTYDDGSFYEFEYDAEGLMTAEIEPNMNRFERLFDANGRLTDGYDQEGGHWNYHRTIFANGEIETKVTTAEGDVVTYQDLNDSNGEYNSTIIGPDGDLTHFSKSADGLIVNKTLGCGMELEFIYAYDPEYHYKFLKDTIEEMPSGLIRVTSNDKIYQDTDLDEIPDLIITTTSMNNKTYTTEKDLLQSKHTITSPEGRLVISTYDRDTLLTQSLNIPGLNEVTYDYDTWGRLTSVSTGARQAFFGYNNDGFLEWTTDPENNTTTYYRDPVGRVASIQRPDGGLIDFIYDQNGNLTMLTNPNTIDHGFGYNRVNMQSSYETPISGSYSYQYDKDRRLTNIAFPSEREILNIYQDGRLTQTHTPEGTIDYAYLCGTKIESITKGSESISYEYDGKLVTSETFSGTLSKALEYTYNNDFNVETFSYAGDSDTYTYDQDGLLTGTGNFSITRNAGNGLPETVSGGSATLARTFNDYGELESNTLNISGTDTVEWSLIRDNNGRITQKSETVGGITVSYAYAYDEVGRLLSVSKDGSLVEQYAYDHNGVRISETNQLRGITGKNYNYSDEEHLLYAGTATYQYDLDGFLTQKTNGSETTYYNYSSQGELLNVTLPDGTSIEYVHGPSGRRIAKKVDGTVTEKYLWLGLTTLLAVYDGSDNLIQRFEYADGRMPIRMTQEGVIYYLGYDQVGSLRAISDSSGNVVKRIDYDLFGNVLADTNPGFMVPFGFAGGFYDKDTGLVRFGCRDYDPDTGRWTAKDPILFSGGDTDLYGYVQNDPVNWIDPLGLFNAKAFYRGLVLTGSGLVGIFAGAGMSSTGVGAILGVPTAIAGAGTFAGGVVQTIVGAFEAPCEDHNIPPGSLTGAVTLAATGDMSAAYRNDALVDTVLLGLTTSAAFSAEVNLSKMSRAQVANLVAKDAAVSAVGLISPNINFEASSK